MAGSNRRVEEYDFKGAKASARAIEQIVKYLQCDDFLCDGARVKVILPPPRDTEYAVQYGKYLLDLHKQLLAKLDYDVYSADHIVRGWYQPRLSKDNNFSAKPGILDKYGVHLSRDGYQILQHFLQDF